MGKVLIEKLLRTCPIKKIYVLVRPKRGVDVKQRIEDMFSYKVRIMIEIKSERYSFGFGFVHGLLTSSPKFTGGLRKN